MEEVPVFHPTEAEFADFRRYVSRVVTPRARGFGLARVVPPAGWAARPGDPSYRAAAVGESAIPAPLAQHVEGGPAVFQQRLEPGHRTTVAKFAEKLRRVGGYSFAKAETPGDTTGSERCVVI
jgi:hypothetical protein